MELHVMLNIFPWEIFYLAHRAIQSQSFLMRTWCYYTEHTRADVSEDFGSIGRNFQTASFAPDPFIRPHVLLAATGRGWHQWLHFPREEARAQGSERLAQGCTPVNDRAGVHTQALLALQQCHCLSMPSLVLKVRGVAPSLDLDRQADQTMNGHW